MLVFSLRQVFLSDMRLKFEETLYVHYITERYVLSYGAAAQRGTWPPHLRGF